MDQDDGRSSHIITRYIWDHRPSLLLNMINMMLYRIMLYINQTTLESKGLSNISYMCRFWKLELTKDWMSIIIVRIGLI
jgi:hypothetical protein